MRRLMLLRHAKSRRAAPDESDIDRPLLPEGEEAAARVGVYMARHNLIPDRVLCSTARRARETWARLATNLPKKPPAVYDERLYQAKPEDILALLREVRNGIASFLIVGHNPELQEFACRLIAAGDVELRERLREEFPSAGLVIIDFPIESWDKLHFHAGRLERFITPEALEAATD